MPERIYTSADDGRLEALEDTPFSSEDEIQALIAKHPELLDGEISYGETYGLSIRAKCSAWKQPISVAWLYSEPGRRGWMRTRDFSFGASAFESELPDELRAILQRWAKKFSDDDFTEDVSSKGVNAWAVTHDDAVQHQDLLVERLSTTFSELSTL